MPLDLTQLRARSNSELLEVAKQTGVDNPSGLKRQDLIFEVVRRRTGSSGHAGGEGVLETLADGFGFLRSHDCNYLPGSGDIYVSPSQIRRFNLRTGDLVGGQVRAPKEGERYFALIKIESVNGASPETERHKPLFDNLTPVHATRCIRGPGQILGLLDAWAPLGFGQRVLVRAPHRSGRSALIVELARELSALADVTVLVLLIDERPEEVTATRRALGVELVSSTFDEPATRHVQVAEMALERAKRIVEQGRDVVLLVDSLTRLARAYNAVAAPGGRQVAGGVDLGSIHRCLRFFGAGRCLEEGGSLTLVGTLLADTGAHVDAILDQEIEGTANAELVLDAGLSARGLRPAIDLGACFSRDEDRLLDPPGVVALSDRRGSLTADRERDLRAALHELEAPAATG